jgi:hypothetical protein
MPWVQSSLPPLKKGGREIILTQELEASLENIDPPSLQRKKEKKNNCRDDNEGKENGCKWSRSQST